VSQVEALYRMLVEAPPRASAIVRRVSLENATLEQVAEDFGIDPKRAKVLIFRAFLEFNHHGPVSDSAEGARVAALWTEGSSERALWQSLSDHREALLARLRKSEEEFERSPDRTRDEWLRRLAIVVVLALTAYFYRREQHRPKPPPERRPITSPVKG
jgi:hypothetical protein